MNASLQPTELFTTSLSAFSVMAMFLLLTPSAYQRIAEPGQGPRFFVKLASRLASVFSSSAGYSGREFRARLKDTSKRRDDISLNHWSDKRVQAQKKGVIALPSLLDEN